MKILITGASGFLGKNLHKKLGENHKVIGTDKNESQFADELLDITDREKTKDFLKKTAPDVIIHGAALTNVNYCQTHQEEAFKANAETTKNLVSSLQDRKTKFILISSDYVYDGKTGNYTENSQTNPLNYYGITKLKAEEIVQKYENHLIFRSTVIFGWDKEGKNFFMQLFRNQKDSLPMKVPVDQSNNPTYINLFVEIIRRSIEGNLKGTFLATGPQTLNRYEFGLKICEVFDFNKDLLVPVKTENLSQTAQRPLNCGTNSAKIRKALKMEFPSLEKSLSDLRTFIYG